MKAIYKNIALTTLALGAVACSQEDDFSSSYLNDPDAVRITAQVGSYDVTGGFTRSNPLGTTTDEQAAFNANNQISVNDVVYTYDGTSWSPETGKYLKWQSDKMTFTAYYPVADGTDAKNFTVPTGYTTDAPIANADYMTYSGEQSKGTDRSINLAMERKMVRIVITPTFNNQFPTDTYSVTAIKVHGNNKGYADGNLEGGNIEVSALQQGDDFYALLAPTSEAPDKTFLTVTVTNNTNPEDVHTLTIKGIPATSAGNSYNYSLAVGKNKVSIKELTITDWSTGGVLDAAGKVVETITWAYEDEIYKVYTGEGLENVVEVIGSNSATIKLMNDIGTTKQINTTEGGNITLDLDNHTLNCYFLVENIGTLTVKNGNLNFDGSNSHIVNQGTLTIENVTCTGECSSYLIGNFSSGTCTIKSGTFTCSKDDGMAVYVNGGKVTIEGGTFTGNIWASDSATLNIEGGTFSVNPSKWVAEGYIASSETDESSSIYWTVSADNTTSE